MTCWHHRYTGQLYQSVPHAKTPARYSTPLFAIYNVDVSGRHNRAIVFPSVRNDFPELSSVMTSLRATTLTCTVCWRHWVRCVRCSRHGRVDPSVLWWCKHRLPWPYVIADSLNKCCGPVMILYRIAYVRKVDIVHWIHFSCLNTVTVRRRVVGG